MVEQVVETQTPLEIAPAQYELVRQLVYGAGRINLGENRQHLVQARLAKLIRVGKLSGFAEYFERLQNDKSGQELGQLIDAISTNTTYFFREADHFDFLVENIVQRIEKDRWAENRHVIRIWSAASSTGEEPYSLAMKVHDLLEAHPTVSVKILATDVSQKVLNIAKLGRYEQTKLRNVPVELRGRYFRAVRDEQGQSYEVAPSVRNLITFGHFNLMNSAYPFKHGFDYIFCRNVMIYFDRATQESVIRKMSAHLRPGGHFIVGHSESLNAIRHDLHYVKPTIYRK